MKRAVVSDIHSNLVAFEAVLRDIERMKVAEVVCLGDVIGYGPRPQKCIDYVRKFFAWSLRGNHEQGLLDPAEAERFSHRAADALAWTRTKLETPDDDETPARKAFLEAMPEKQQIDDVLFCHGSPRLPVEEYIYPDLGRRHPERLRVIFEILGHVVFVGHTHIPGVLLEDGSFRTPADLGNEYEIGPGKAVINVGSVGQPRDRNPRASYAVVDDDTVVFRRVQYDVEVAANQIYAVPELDDGLGDRLLEGR